ncbi:MAG: ABC transporter permease [Lachnospiraceae bacterium]|nr:ABC transporter permease [Lachnospiraceae bacterium]
MRDVIRKLASMILTLLIVSFLVFLAFDLIPGDPAIAKLGTQATPEQVASLRAEWGLDRPFLIRYFDWLFSFVRGDMGYSYHFDRAVTELLSGKILITVTLVIMAFVMIVSVSIPMGIFAARHQGGALDKSIMVSNQLLMAIPPFFSGILITFLFGVGLSFFKPGSFVSYTQNFGGFLFYMIFPALAVAIPKIAMCVKLLRSSILEQWPMDYVRTAYSRGNRTMQVLYRHVLRNAMIPVVTFLGMTLADMVAGSIIIEKVFNIPGIGQILIKCIEYRDYPTVEAVVMLIAFLVVFVNFMVDIIYRILDPRMRQSS